MTCGESSILIRDISSRGRADLAQRSTMLKIATIALNISLNRSLTRTFYLSYLSIR